MRRSRCRAGVRRVRSGSRGCGLCLDAASVARLVAAADPDRRLLPIRDAGSSATRAAPASPPQEPLPEAREPGAAPAPRPAQPPPEPTRRRAARPPSNQRRELTAHPPRAFIDFDEERRRAANQVIGSQAENEYLTFSIDDVAPPRPEEEPEPKRSIFDPVRAVAVPLERWASSARRSAASSSGSATH